MSRRGVWVCDRCGAEVVEDEGAEYGEGKDKLFLALMLGRCHPTTWRVVGEADVCAGCLTPHEIVSVDLEDKFRRDIEDGLS